MKTIDETAGGKPSPKMVHLWAIKVIVIPLLFSVVPLLLFLLGAGLEVGTALLWLSPPFAMVVVGYAWAFLYHRYYRWELGREEVRIWRGILFRKRVTIPYMRVQNVNVVRGPLLLMFGLSGVEVETAGQKGSYYSLQGSEGYLPGLKEGEEVADEIIERVKGAKGREGL